MSKKEYTPTPWEVVVTRYNDGTDRILGVHIARGKLSIASLCDGPQDKVANAEFIVRACNSHEKLLEACKEVEWAHIPFGSDDFICPSCRRTQESGHAKGCSLAAAIAAVEVKE